MNSNLLKRGTVITLAIMLGLSVAACGKKARSNRRPTKVMNIQGITRPNEPF